MNNVLLFFSGTLISLAVMSCTPTDYVSSSEFTYEQAMRSYEAGDYRKSADLLYDFVQGNEECSKWDDGWYYLGKSYRRLAENDDDSVTNLQLIDSAVNAFSMVTERSPRWIDSRTQSAQCELDKNELDRASIHLTELFRDYPHGPNSGEICWSIGQCCEAQENTAEAYRWYFRAVDSIADSEVKDRGLYALGQLFREDGKWDSAQIFYNRLLAEYPNSSKADNACIKFAKRFWDQYDSLMNLAEYDDASKKRDSSMVWYAKIRSDYKNSGSYDDALYRIGYLFYLQKFVPDKRDSAIAVYTEYTSISSDTASVEYRDVQTKLAELKSFGVGND